MDQILHIYLIIIMEQITILITPSQGAKIKDVTIELTLFSNLLLPLPKLHPNVEQLLPFYPILEEIYQYVP